MKVSDVIRNVSDEDMAKIIGSVVLKMAYGVSTEQSSKIEFNELLKILRTEIDDLT